MHPDQQVFKSHGGKQAGLGWFSLGVGLVLLVAFRSFDGSGMTNSLAGFLLGLFLFLLGLAALFAHTKQTMVFVVITGILVFLTAYLSNIPLLVWVFSKPIGIIASVSATICLFLILRAMKREKLFPVRVLAGFQVVMILVAATYQHNPNIILFGNGEHLSLLEHAASAKTISALGWALVLGSMFILPFLFYLMFSFSRQRK